MNSIRTTPPKAAPGLILLICGEDLSRRILKVVLEASGYRVIESGSVAEGMRHCLPRGLQPALTVVVADLGGGLWASLDLLRSALNHSPLLVMSPEEVACLLDSLAGDSAAFVEGQQGKHGQWLARVHLVLKEGWVEGPESLLALAG